MIYKVFNSPKIYIDNKPFSHMNIDAKSINKFSAMAIILFLVIATFILLKPIFLAIITGLILAYIVNPIYKKTNSFIKRPTISAFVVSFLLLALVLIPLWFLVPVLVNQVFEIFKFMQGISFGKIVSSLFKGVPPEFTTQLSSVLSNFVNNTIVGVLNWLAKFLLDLPNLLLQGAVFIFVFFFTLRDQEKLKKYVSELSPLKKQQEKIFIDEFKGITNSIIFGYIIIGLIQGVVAGIGFFVFGVPRALFLTILAVFSSMFPLFGPWLVWVPAAIYLFSQGNVFVAIIFTVYCVLIVSSLDNILRPYIVSKNSSISPVVALIGMIGGLLVFGLLGLVLGPLILAYLIIFLTAYKNKQLSSMFHQG